VATGVYESEITAPTARETRAKAPSGERPRWWRWLRWAAMALAVLAIGTSPWWGPPALATFEYFHVRRVVIDGVRYGRAAELVRVLQVDTLQSVWQPLPPLVERLATHPIFASATVERRLPGELLVHVVEREPVALVPADGRLVPADGAAHRLPIDPTAVPLDLPLAASADTALLTALDALRRGAPGLYARITQAERVGADELRFRLGALVVRTMPDVTVARFKDILPVEADMARNGLRAVELDLRFRDQVIARQP
jgi:cell division protein FtsQ